MAQNKLKVKDLADMVGLSPSYLSLVLSGERQNLSDYHKDAIALALGTSVAFLYTPEDPGFSQAVSDSGPVYKRTRDVGAFEDFLRAANIRDDALLSAVYKELNSLSDDEVRRFGQAVRGALASWQEAVARAKAVSDAGAVSWDTPAGPAENAQSEGGLLLNPRITGEQRRFLGLIACLSAIFGDVPLAMIEIATAWPSARVHQMLDPAVSAGALFPVQEQAGYVSLRPSGLLNIPEARGWPAPAFKTECMSRLANSLAQSLEYIMDGGLSGGVKVEDALPFKARPDQVAEAFLEARDYARARVWYEKAAVDAFGQNAWRVAKQYLMIVSSLDGILRTQSEDRVRAYQMLAAACLNLGEADEALVYQERNLAFWERAGRKSDLTMGFLRASSMHGRKRDWAKAKDCLERALKVSGGDLAAEAQARIGLASIFISTGSLASAKEELERALGIGGKLDESGILVQSLLGLGRVLASKGDPRRALAYLNQGLSLAERREPVAETWLMIEVGKIFFQEGDIDKAKGQLLSAVERARAARNSEQEQYAASHLARCLAAAQDRFAPEEALNLAASAERYFAGTGDRRGRVEALAAYAESKAALDDIAGAFECFREAAREARESGDPALESFACDAFGRHLESRGDQLAEVMYRRARWARARMR